MKHFFSKGLLSSLSVLGSGFCFYMSTVSIRWARQDVFIEPVFFVFSRFFLGIMVVGVIFVAKKKRPRPRRYDLLITRALFNVIAVYCFFKGVHETTVAEANILNMTYPIFIAMITWIFMKDQRNLKILITVLIAFTGVVLVLNRGSIEMKWENLWALASGITAAFAIIALNSARQHNDTDTVLLFTFGGGCGVIYLLFHEQIYLPNFEELYYLSLCAAMAITGQYLLTLGLKYISAVESSIISSTRILLAAFLGPLIASDPALTLTGWMGALLIFGANVYVAWCQVRAK
ncbi:DMT family transporter [Deltaproteobacteria bacterium TL4]